MKTLLKTFKIPVPQGGAHVQLLESCFYIAEDLSMCDLLFVVPYPNNSAALLADSDVSDNFSVATHST